MFNTLLVTLFELMTLLASVSMMAPAARSFSTNLWPLFCAALPRAPLGAHRTRRPGTLPGRLSHASQASHTPGESGRLKAPT